MRDLTRLLTFALLLLNLVISPSYIAGQACTTPPPNMVAWWTGDGNATDLAGPNNGKLINGATFAAGYVGKAFALNGSGQYVDVKTAKPLDVSAGDFSVDAWVYFNAIGGNDQSIVDKMFNSGFNQNPDGWRLLLQADDMFWFCLGNGGNGCSPPDSTTVTSTTSAAAGTWYFVAATKTSTEISMYVNGNLENTTSLGAFTDTNKADLLIGANKGQGSYLNGSVDEVELFNRALTPSEISAIYNAGHTGKCKVLVGLTPSKLTFAAQTVGTTSPPQPVTLKNKSPNGGVLNITSIATTGDFGHSACPSSLNPGQKCVIEVTFTPTAVGTRTGTLSVTDNSPNGLPQKVRLTGTGQ